MKRRMGTVPDRLSNAARAVLRKLWRDRRGSPILEFALVAAPLIALLIASLETAIVFFAQQGLETSTEAAARFIMTGQAQQGSWSQTTFQQKVCATLPSYFDCTQLLVSVQQVSSFGSANTSTPTITFDPKTGKPNNTLAYDIGGADTVVVVRLMYLWPLPNGPLGFSLNNQGNQRVMIATSVAQTEHYQ